MQVHTYTLNFSTLVKKTTTNNYICSKKEVKFKNVWSQLKTSTIMQKFQFCTINHDFHYFHETNAIYVNLGSSNSESRIHFPSLLHQRWRWSSHHECLRHFNNWSSRHFGKWYHQPKWVPTVQCWHDDIKWIWRR